MYILINYVYYIYYGSTMFAIFSCNEHMENEETRWSTTIHDAYHGYLFVNNFR
jgi:hypothetical protein